MGKGIILRFKEKLKVNKKSILKGIGAAACIVIIVGVGLQTPFFHSNNVVKGGYDPQVEHDATGTGSYLDAGDAERVEAKTTNEMLREATEAKNLPVMQLNKYENVAVYEEFGGSGNTLASFALHIENKFVHIQYLYLENCASLTTSSKQQEVDTVQNGELEIKIYSLASEDGEQYFAYITKDAYMISIGTDMAYEEFCDFLKDLSIK